jgi:hypothetical protein
MVCGLGEERVGSCVVRAATEFVCAAFGSPIARAYPGACFFQRSFLAVALAAWARTTSRGSPTAFR